MRLKLFGCTEFGDCTPETKLPGHACCKGCAKYEAPSAAPKPFAGMISPRDRRQVYRGGILQIHLTRACDRACFNCTQGSNLAGPVEFMSLDQFRVAVDSLKDYFGVVGIFGGNPTLHPQFEEICEILRGAIPFEQRGLWSNHPKDKGAVCRITFNPAHSNLNVHECQEAYDEFARDWPECQPFLKGLDQDSRHSPPFVAMKDIIPDEAERWKLINSCDINRNWSAMIGVFRGQLRGWFCEIAGAQSMLHQHEPDYPDTGVPIVPGWWDRPIDAFEDQIRKHCHECGVPLRGYGELANNPNGKEQCSATHAGIYRPKRPGREVEVVTELIQLGKPLERVTDYLPNDTNPQTYPGLRGKSLMKPSELKALIELIPEQGRVLEVGSADGVTAAKMAVARPHAYILSVDPHIGTEGEQRRENWLANRRPNQDLFTGTLYKVRTMHDVILVDGSHEEGDVYSDLENAEKLVNEGGCLVAHDYGEADFPGVKAATDRFLSENPAWRMIRLVSTLGVMRRAE